MKSNSPFVLSLNQQILEKYPPLKSYLGEIGETDFIKVPGCHREESNIFAKFEFQNPNGTVKDRAVFGMIYQLLARRNEIHDLKIIEYTGGSLGLALSDLCKKLKIPLTLAISEAAGGEVIQKIKSDGTDLLISPRVAGFWHVMESAKNFANQNPEYEFLFQHENSSNLWMHEKTTGQEILDAIRFMENHSEVPKRISLVASIGTGGTLIGIFNTLSKFYATDLIAVSPQELPYGSPLPPNGLKKFAGSGGLGLGRKQFFVQPFDNQVHEHYKFSYPECLKAMRLFFNSTGIRLGSSAAANWLASCEVAKANPDHMVVTVFPSLATDSEWQEVQAST